MKDNIKENHKKTKIIYKDTKGKFGKNLTDKQFGNLTALSCEGKDNNHCFIWLCKCKCGNLRLVRGYELMRNRITSCEKCVKKQRSSKTKKYHNEKIRNKYCRLKNELCDEWKNNYESFEKYFLKNKYAINNRLVRIDKNKPFSPENILFQPIIKKTINTTKYGTITLYRLSEIENINFETLRHRYMIGIRGDEILKPTRKYKKF